MNIIEIRHLKKSFKDVHAVNDISFRVKEGELFSFLGLNGAGKSTTISIICGQLKKDDGEILINGRNIETESDEIKRELGIVFQGSVLDKVLSVRDNLRSRAALYGITGKAFESRLREIDEILELHALLPRPYGKLSGGQRRRVDFARALLPSPKILILDEPTTGLDPQSRMLVWNAVNRLRKQSRLTVFLTTHYMEEAAESDYVVILDSGKIVAEGTPNDLKNAYTGDFIRLYGISKEALAEENLSFTEENGYLKIPVKNTAEAKKLITEKPRLFEDFEIVKGNMDDVFLAATGKRLKEADL